MRTGRDEKRTPACDPTRRSLSQSARGMCSTCRCARACACHACGRGAKGVHHTCDSAAGGGQRQNARQNVASHRASRQRRSACSSKPAQAVAQPSAAWASRGCVRRTSSSRSASRSEMLWPRSGAALASTGSSSGHSWSAPSTCQVHDTQAGRAHNQPRAALEREARANARHATLPRSARSVAWSACAACTVRSGSASAGFELLAAGPLGDEPAHFLSHEP